MVSLRRKAGIGLVIPAAIGAAMLAFAQERAGPDEWLEDMTRVVGSIDYEGTVIRRQNGKSVPLKVVRRVIDGVVNEKVVYQEGNGLEIIRFGNEVHCVLPDKKSVLIEQWNKQSMLFSSLPAGDARFGSQYNVSVVREERVAGRAAVLVAVRPHDDYRFGHRLWLDRETAFPLRTELIKNDGTLIEQIKFAEVSLGEDIPADALASSFDLQHFTWYAEPEREAVVEVDADWISTDLPNGFQLVSTTTEKLSGSDTPVTHMIYGDGLAMVSVFIGRKGDQAIARRSNVGASNSYSIERNGFQVTAIGAVPDDTVQRIASSMRER